MLFDGSVHKALDEAAVRRIGAEMVSEGIESVGICFLHSYANPAHEQRAAAILREVAPKLSITLSYEVSPVIREYERGSTTTLNAMSCRRCGATSNGWPAACASAATRASCS